MLVWFVTGCSSGLGEEFIHQIVTRGDKVIATGRNAESRLLHLKGIGAATVDLDITTSPEIIKAKIQEAISIFGKIDILVNNAGYSHCALSEDIGPDLWKAQLDTNFFGHTYVTQALLPHFRARKTGTIAFINSIYSWVGEVAVGPYAVSKHALSGYARGLQKEVAQFGIQTVQFDVGHFRTKILGGDNFRFQESSFDDYTPMLNGLMPFIASMPGNQPGDVKKGVKAMIDVLTREGQAKDKKIPERIPIGPDAMQIVRDYCKEMLQACDEWEDLSTTTDHEGPKQGAWALSKEDESTFAVDGITS